ncbi:hypothetical protein [Polynucleobacter antarcticus]|uniref:hypothetical protein n=1 Tax=Polynucleobacter antarcticus TaxID=1743162 RepID=UPI00156E3C3E|nr:hypothetical protein [Polynucleobacter antarcticus]
MKYKWGLLLAVAGFVIGFLHPENSKSSIAAQIAFAIPWVALLGFFGLVLDYLLKKEDS